MYGNELRAMRLWETGLSQVWAEERVPIPASGHKVIKVLRQWEKTWEITT